MSILKTLAFATLIAASSTAAFARGGHHGHFGGYGYGHSGFTHYYGGYGSGSYRYGSAYRGYGYGNEYSRYRYYMAQGLFR